MTRTEHNKRKGRSSSQLLRPEKRQRIYARDHFRCQWCRRHASEPGVKLTIDHLLPRALGGDNATENMFTACAKCNFKRQDRPVTFMFRLLLGKEDVSVEVADLILQAATPLRQVVP